MSFFDWSLIDWSIRLALLLPVLSIVVILVMRKSRGVGIHGFFLSLSGVAGMVAGMQGATTDAPFTLQTPVFFSMAMVFDKFGAIFFLPLSFVVFLVGLFLVHHRATLMTQTPAILHLSTIALAIIGMQWVLIAGNIVGLVAAWQVIVFACALLRMHARGSVSPADALRVLFVGLCSTALVAAGFFLLSSGALFSDFSTLSYIAAQIPSTSLILACIALALGFGIPLVAGALLPKTTVHHCAGSSVAMALLQGAGIGLGLYGIIRALLFILPPLSLWFAFPLLGVGAIVALFGAGSAVRSRDRQTILLRMTTSTMGSTAVMIGLAMCLQTLGAFEPMNVVLFSALLSLGAHAVVMSGLWLLIGAQESGAASQWTRISAGVLTLTIAGLPPFSLFVGFWMTGNTLVGILHSIADLWFALGTAAFLLLSVLTVGFMAVASRQLFMLLAESAVTHDGGVVTEKKTMLDLVVILPAIVAMAIGFGAPRILEAIGAGPLTIAPQTWLGAIIASAAMLQMMALALILVAGVALAFVLRQIVWKNIVYADTSVVAQDTSPASDVHHGDTSQKILKGQILVGRLHAMVQRGIFLPVLRILHRFFAAIRDHEDRQISLTLIVIALTLVITFIFAL